MKPNQLVPGLPFPSLRAGAHPLSWVAAPPAAGTPEDRSTEFVAVQGGTETTSAEALLVTAYFVMWAALLGFIFLTWRRQGQLEARLAGLQGQLERLGNAEKKA